MAGATIAALVAATAIVQTQDVTFSTHVEAVRVDVLVTDNGQPVRGGRVRFRGFLKVPCTVNT